MRSPCVVECQIVGDAAACGRHGVVGMQLNLFVFDATPQTLDEDVVAPGPFSVHDDLEARVPQRLDKVDGCELAALVRVHDLRLAETADRLFQRIQAERCFQRDREPPGQH
jgi:hypothetical protein